jgi:hypothetical protein
MMNDEPMDEPQADAFVIEPDTAPVEENLEDRGPASPVEMAGKARLTLKRGGELTDQVFYFASPAIVGRFDPSVGPIDVDLGSLPEGSYVSRKHAKITFEDNGFHIQDLGSSNGTYVLRDDYEKVEEAPISDGDTIGFGNAIFVFNVEG